jgi:sigma-54 dependent transcriptional regulator, acetoin dehydrogenase operon transcriptional activator AcoR
MFDFEQIHVDNAFKIVQPDTNFAEITADDKKHLIIEKGNLFYIITKQERLFLPQSNPGTSLSEWIDQMNWLPSPFFTEEEFQELPDGLSRPALIGSKQGEVQGIITQEEMIHYLLKQNRQLSAYFTTLAETVNDAITAVNRDGQVICWNKVAEQTYGIKQDKILGRKIGEHFEKDAIMLHRILDEGRPVRQIYHQPRPDKHVLINASPILEDNQIIGGIATEQDITRIVRLNEELYSKASLQLEQEEPFSSILGMGHAVQEAIRVAKKMTRTNIPVLFLGEPGTGKKLFAQAIHYSGDRKKGNLLSLHCGAIPPGLLETELFGYQGGAFTGDEQSGKAGRLEETNGGTLYLEEIHEMLPETQAKLLQFLHNGRFTRVGGTQIISVDSRIIASSSHNLRSLVDAGLFLEELYYHLSVVSIELPPLTERMEDIPELVQSFLREFSIQYEKPVPKMEPTVMSALMNYEWPGNIKELRNVIERLIILNDNDRITVESLPKEMITKPDETTDLEDLQQPSEFALKARLSNEKEAEYIEEALRKTYGNKSAAAKLLGISRGTLYNKMKEYGLG